MYSITPGNKKTCYAQGLLHILIPLDSHLPEVRIRLERERSALNQLKPIREATIYYNKKTAMVEIFFNKYFQ